MKKQILKLAMLLTALVALTISSCKKESTTDDSVAAGDASNISSVMNTTGDDADNSMSTNHTISGKTEGLLFEQLYNATVAIDSTTGTATITYNGTDYYGIITRTGTITVQLLGFPAVHWKDAGATLQLTYNLTATINGLTYKFTGTHYIENVNGGLAYQVMDGLTPGITVVRKHTCNNDNITFPDGSQRLWSFNRVRTFSNPGGINPTITLSGDTTINGVLNVAQWGTDRVGEAFYAAIPTTISSDFACGFFHPTVGEHVHHVANRTVTIVYGVDQNGVQHTGTGCAYGYQMTWTKGSKSYTQVFQY